MSFYSVTSWTVARQSPLSMEFSRQGYWSGLPLPTPRDLPNPGIKLMSPALAGGFFTTKPLGNPIYQTGVSYLILFNILGDKDHSIHL